MSPLHVPPKPAASAQKKKKNKKVAAWAAGEKLEAAIYAQYCVKSVDPSTIFHDDAIETCDLDGTRRVCEVWCGTCRLCLTTCVCVCDRVIFQPFLHRRRLEGVAATERGPAQATGSPTISRIGSETTTTSAWAFGKSKRNWLFVDASALERS